MAVDVEDGHRRGNRDVEQEPVSEHRINPLVWRMGGLARAGAAEAVSTDQSIRRERGREDSFYIFS